jgi:hypothetical protein
LSHRTLSAGLTVILLLLAGAVVLLAEIVAFNGFSDRQGILALAGSLDCQGMGMFIAAVVAMRLSGWLVTKSTGTWRFPSSLPLSQARCLAQGLP